MNHFYRLTIILVLLGLAIAGCKDPDGISILESSDGYNAISMTKPINSANPIVVTLHGAEGGYLPNELLRPLVKQGFDVVNLSYFGSKGLPEKLELIPLEYLNNAISSIKQSNPGRKIVLLGVSRGAEYGLLYASRFNNINGLIAYAPSFIVLPESWHNADPSTFKSSWTFNGEAVPFTPVAPLHDTTSEITYRDYFPPLFIFQDSSGMNKNLIPVENISCPVQLISGKADLFWPSSEMGEIIMDKMSRNPNALVFHDSYEGVGHDFLFFGDDPVGKTSLSNSIKVRGKKYNFLYGGDEEAMWAGMIRGRDRTLYFLNKVKL